MYIFIEFFIKVVIFIRLASNSIIPYHLAITSGRRDDLGITSVRCNLPKFGKGHGKHFCSKLMDCPLTLSVTIMSNQKPRIS